MKGTCYGGVIYLPSHPDSDMHGLLRCVVRTKSWLYCENAIESLQLTPWKARTLLESNIWQPSKSAVEQLVSETHYGEILVCPLVSAYISPEKYKRLAPEFYPKHQPASTKSEINPLKAPK